MITDSLSKRRVSIYTDGAAVPNPGRGGYGVVIRRGSTAYELSGAFLRTTNNRMELMGAIVALESLEEPSLIELHSDSEYLVNAFLRCWIYNWESSNWKRRVQGKLVDVINVDLWKRLLAACNQHSVTFIWVKGHAGNRDNERCDTLANDAIRSGTALNDSGYVLAKGMAPGTAKGKLWSEGDQCNGQHGRMCDGHLVKKAVKKTALKPGQLHYFRWKLECSKCRKFFHDESAKVFISGSTSVRE